MASPKPAPKPSTRTDVLVIGSMVGLAVIVFLMYYRLGSIMPGITASENSIHSLPLGLHGLYHYPLNLPMNGLWSLVFKYLAPVSAAALRAPAALIGGLTILAFFALLKLWYGSRTALFGTVMFSLSAWTLHVSRLADLNVEYLGAMTFFLLTTALLHKQPDNKYVYPLINLTWSILLYVPGMAWFIGYNLFRQRQDLKDGAAKQTGTLAKSSYFVSSFIWIPLLVRFFIRTPKNVLAWLGLPTKYASPLHIVKEFGAVFVHIFAHGPLIPSLWLGRTPILDIFSIITAACGLYFYIRHYSATRSHLIFVSFLVGAVLIALGGSVPLSIVMPLIYVLIAAGIAYLLQQWLAVFPNNPIARTLGYSLITLAVAASCIYNVRAYFIAWPHNSTSRAVFDVKRSD